MLFDSTLRRDLARSFAATLVVILTIVLTMMLIRALGQAAGGVVAPQDVALVLGYFGLQHLPTMLALSLFIAIVSTLGRMYRESEMVIWFAAGIGLPRFVRPVMQTSWPVLLVIALLLVFVWPWSQKNTIDLRARYQQRSDLSRVTPGVFQTSRDGRRVFFIDRGTGDAATGRNVFILTHDKDRESVTSARSGRLENRDKDRLLVLEHGHRNETDSHSGEKTVAGFDTYQLVVWEAAVQRAEDAPPRVRPTWDLLQEPTLKNQAELSWRFGLAMGAANLLLLGIGLAATNPRRASNWNLLFALLAFVVYYNLINLSQAWIASGRLGFGTTLFGLHGTVFVMALALLWWRDHAATSRSKQRRGAA